MSDQALDLDVIKKHFDNVQLRMEREYDFNDLETVADYYVHDVTALVEEMDRLCRPQGTYAADLPAIAKRLEDVHRGLRTEDVPWDGDLLAAMYETDARQLSFEVACRRAAMNTMTDSPLLTEWREARARTVRAYEAVDEALRLAMGERIRVRFAEARNCFDRAITQEAYEAVSARKLIESWLLQAGVGK